MTFPGTHRAITEMILDTALQTPMARSIVRKAGLRQGVGETSAFTRTLIDAWIDIRRNKECWQWDVDLTAYTAIRFMNRSNGPLFVVYSEAGYGSETLDPEDYQLFPTLWPLDPYGYPTSQLESGFSTSSLAGGWGWAAIREDLRMPMRISLSLGLDEDTGSYWTWRDEEEGGAEAATGFSIGLQVR